MAIGLYTSRIVLQVLGVDNYGIYNIVGGFISMFSLISGSLSSSIQRFITFELGTGNKERLRKIVSTGINVQIGISLVVILLAESFGLWFLNNRMNIPVHRLYAANLVYHISLVSFVINLLSVPYNAIIVAHEKMSAFAAISFLEIVMKLVIVFLLYISSYDKLIVYSVLLLVIAFIIRTVYWVYCKRHFEESRYKYVHDVALMKEMSRFAGLTFLTGTAYLFNTQGVNILINIFFNVGVNAARGIATTVQTVTLQFADNFSFSLSPQITKLYASGNIMEMEKLVIRGAKFSFILALLICLPVIMETEYILQLWLKEVPPHTAAFVRLSIIGVIIDKLGSTSCTACMATGEIRQYVALVASIGCLVFPLTFLAYYMGAPVETTYVILALVYIGVDGARLFIMKGLLHFPIWNFINEVILRCIAVSATATLIPVVYVSCFPPSLTRFVTSTIMTVALTAMSSYLLGLNKDERKFFTVKASGIIKGRLGLRL